MLISKGQDVKIDQLATGWWTQMDNSTEGTVDWFIEMKGQGEQRSSGVAGRQVWRADEQEDVTRSVTGRDETHLLGV